MMATEPSSVALREESPPWNAPSGVRATPTMKTASSSAPLAGPLARFAPEEVDMEQVWDMVTSEKSGALPGASCRPRALSRTRARSMRVAPPTHRTALPSIWQDALPWNCSWFGLWQASVCVPLVQNCLRGPAGRGEVIRGSACVPQRRPASLRWPVFRGCPMANSPGPAPFPGSGIRCRSPNHSLGQKTAGHSPPKTFPTSIAVHGHAGHAQERSPGRLLITGRFLARARPPAP